MSFSASNQKLKSFITEDEANDFNAKKQAEWEKVRRPEDPLERPVEEHRSLFEQLQQQKEKTQQEHDEKYNLKNMIRGIDNDEAAFLEFASQQQAEMDGRRFADTSEVKEYRSEVAQLQATMISSSTSDALKERKKPQNNKKSQVELLAGVIKTKRKRSESGETEQSKIEDTSVVNTECEPSQEEDEAGGKKQCPSKEDDTTALLMAEQPHLLEQNQRGDIAATVGYCRISNYKPMSIPSLGIYSDSSDSDSSSSDSDILPSLFSMGSSSNNK